MLSLGSAAAISAREDLVSGPERRVNKLGSTNNPGGRILPKSIGQRCNVSERLINAIRRPTSIVKRCHHGDRPLRKPSAANKKLSTCATGSASAVYDGCLQEISHWQSQWHTTPASLSGAFRTECGATVRISLTTLLRRSFGGQFEVGQLAVECDFEHRVGSRVGHQQNVAAD